LLCQPEAVEDIQIAAVTQVAGTKRSLGHAYSTPNTHQFYQLVFYFFFVNLIVWNFKKKIRLHV
jgi:hypothetical protein